MLYFGPPRVGVGLLLGSCGGCMGQRAEPRPKRKRMEDDRSQTPGTESLDHDATWPIEQNNEYTITSTTPSFPPFYLRNFEIVMTLAFSRFAYLLSGSEIETFHTLMHVLPLPARRLFVRLSTRKGLTHAGRVPAQLHLLNSIRPLVPCAYRSFEQVWSTTPTWHGAKATGEGRALRSDRC